MNRHIRVAGVVLGVVLLSVAAPLALLQPWESGSDPVQAFNSGKWRSKLEASFADVRPGSQYQLIVKEYNRHGSGASIIQESELYTPESTVRTSLHTFDDAGGVVTFASVLTDAETGEELHRVELSGSTIIINDYRANVPSEGRTREEQAPPYVLSVDATRQQLMASEVRLAKRIVSADYAAITERDDVIVVKESSVLPSVTGGSDALTIPYVRDLNPVSAFRLSTFDKDTYRLISEEVYAVVETGDPVLLSRMEYDITISK